MSSQPASHSRSVAAPLPALWTRSYVLLIWLIMLGYASTAVLVPAIPLYVTSLGGSGAVVGFVLAAFTVTSFIARPTTGWLTDRWGAATVLIISTVGLALTGFAHAVPLIWALAIAGALRGVVWASLNTASYALLGQIAPPARLTAASAYFNLAQNLPYAAFPALAVWLIDVPGAGFLAVFATSGILGLLAAGTVLGLPRERESAHDAATSRGAQLSRFEAGAGSERTVRVATLLSACVAMCYPAISAFIPLYAQAIAVDNVAVYYVANAAAGVIARVLMGRIGDQIRSETVIVGGLVVGAFGLGLVLYGSNLAILSLGGALFAVGHAGIVTSTMTLAIERADPRRRGAAMGFYTLAFPGGMSLGAAVAGVLIDLWGFGPMYAAFVGVMLFGMALTVTNWTYLKRPERAM